MHVPLQSLIKNIDVPSS